MKLESYNDFLLSKGYFNDKELPIKIYGIIEKETDKAVLLRTKFHNPSEETVVKSIWISKTHIYTKHSEPYIVSISNWMKTKIEQDNKPLKLIVVK